MYGVPYVVGRWELSNGCPDGTSIRSLHREGSMHRPPYFQSVTLHTVHLHLFTPRNFTPPHR